MDEPAELALAMNAALVGVPAAYATSGSLVVTALAAATAAIAAFLVARARRH